MRMPRDSREFGRMEFSVGTAEVMGTERLTGALLDRLTHRIHILEANGENYRLRESKDHLKRRRTTRQRK